MSFTLSRSGDGLAGISAIEEPFVDDQELPSAPGINATAARLVGGLFPGLTREAVLIGAVALAAAAVAAIVSRS